MPLPAIETQGLTRRFGRHLAVDGISMHIPERSVYGFIGHNGAGKTTTIKLLLGLLRADAGTARIGGIDVADDRRSAARRIGALLEAQGLYPHLSGRENLDLTRRLRGLPATELDRVLDIVGMRPHRHGRVSGYSLGMRQRLGIARALLGAPPVLILDEPTNGLDPEGIADMRLLLRQLPDRCGATVLVSSHLLGEIEQVATDVGILRQGRLVLQGGLGALKSGLAAELRIETDAPHRACALAREQGVHAAALEGDTLVLRLRPQQDVRREAAALNRMLCSAGLHVHALVRREHTLEHLYREAVEDDRRSVEEPPVAAAMKRRGDAAAAPPAIDAS